MPSTENDYARWHRLSAAVEFALQIHATQTRKGAGTPYIGHLLGVASLVLEHGGDEEQAMAGMLHDAVEDQGAHQAVAIAERFGPRVAAIVLGCTDADTLPKPPWRARKEAYIAHLEQAGPDVLLVSCADKLHNARAICTDLRTHGLAVFDRFTGARDGTLWYYKTLAATFDRLLPGPLSSELAEVVERLEELSRALVET
jgi:GTP pyrophosphokinase